MTELEAFRMMREAVIDYEYHLSEYERNRDLAASGSRVAKVEAQLEYDKAKAVLALALRLARGSFE
jgi:hypothetical protein